MSTQTDAYSFLQPSSHPGDLGVLGNYRILGELGRGGMGFVFRAEDTVLERAVALKVMNKKIASTPNSRDRFLQEARAMAAVHHDNVVVIFEVGLNDGTPFMAMEMLRGETLEAVNARKEGRDYETVIACASQIAKGLAAAHAKGIVHRDIKPANIWIEEGSQRIKILDFGLALAQSPLDEFAGVGAVCGTPGYLTPEQARSDPLDDRSDLYSLGVVLYEMCTGRLPIQRPAIAEQLVALLSHSAKPLREYNPDIPQPLADLIHELLAKEPGDRPKSAMALEKQLKQVAVECDAKSETALSLNKLQESLKEVVSKQDEVEEPIEIVEEVSDMPTYDPLATPAIPAVAANPTLSPPGTPTVGQRVGTPVRPRPKATPQPVATPVSPVVWLAAGVGITVGIIGLVFWMFVLPPKQEAYLVQVPNASSNDSPQQTKSSPTKSPKTSPQPAPNTPSSINQDGNAGNGQNKSGDRQSSPNQSNQNPIKKRRGKGGKGKGKGYKAPDAGVSKIGKQTKLGDQVEPAKTAEKPPSIKPIGEPDTVVAMKVEANEPNSPMNDTPDPPTLPKDVPEKTQRLTVTTLDGIGADATVRAMSANLSLGDKTTLVVQMKQDEELQHAYLRFDLQSLADRKEVRRAALSLYLMNASDANGLKLRLHGTDAAAAEKWAEQGPMSLKWNNSFSVAGLSGLPVLAEFSGGGEGVVTFQSDALAEFIRQSNGRSVTFVVAGGLAGKLAVRFASKEKNDIKRTPTLFVIVPQP